MINKLDWSKENIIAYEASGVISKEEHIQIYSELQELIAKYGKLRIFIRLPKMAWPEPAALSLRFSFARKHINDFEKYAVVSNLKIIPWLISIIDLISMLFSKTRYRHYRIEDELLAKTWIEAKHV